MPADVISVERLDQKHEEVHLYETTWDRLSLLNKSGRELQSQANKFLLMRPKEALDVYNKRIERFVYQPLLPTILGWYEGKLFANEPRYEFSPDDAFWGDWQGNVDRGGTTFTDFFRKVSTDIKLFGRSWVLTDLPRPEIEDEPGVLRAPQSRADELAAGLDSPYLVRYGVDQVINWSKDDFGNLQWAVVKCLEVEQETAFDSVSKETYWYIFDRQKFYTYRAVKTPDGKEAKAAEKVAEGNHALAKQNRCPLRCISVPDALWLANRAFLHLLDHLDTENTYAWKLFMANLALLVITGQADIGNITVGEATYLHLPDAGAKAQYLEPDAATFQESRTRLSELREEVYRSFHLQAQGRSSAATPAAQSGYSKEQDMAPANDVLNQYGDILRASMQLVLGDVADARGSASKANVQGFQFESKPVLKETEIAESVQALGITCPTLEKEIDKRVALAYLDDANDDIKQKAIKEIEEAPTRAEQLAAEQQQQLQSFQTSMQRATSKALVADQANAAA